MNLLKSLNAIPLALSYLVLGTLAVLRHVAATLVLRPRWASLGDNAASMLWFAGACVAANVLRWNVFGDLDMLSALSAGMVYLVATICIFERKNRSSALVFMGWGMSAGLDLVACTLLAMGAPANEGDLRVGLLALEIGYWVSLALDFRGQPKNIQASGYHRGKILPRRNAAASEDRA